MLEPARSVALKAVASAAWRLTTFAARLDGARSKLPSNASDERSLAGDRELEWSWCLSRLPSAPGRLLDFGAGSGILSIGGVLAGHRVLAVDLEPNRIPLSAEALEYRRGDFNEMSLEDDSFDQVINCSSIEHVGLAGRYGSPYERDGDLRAMAKMARLLRRNGTMLLTLPLGRDGIFPPYHRIYGRERLPRLLEGFEIREERYWTKRASAEWSETDRDAALDEQGSERFYALGLFVLIRP